MLIYVLKYVYTMYVYIYVFPVDDIGTRAQRPPGASWVFLSIVFVFSDPENPRVTDLNAIQREFSEHLVDDADIYTRA